MHTNTTRKDFAVASCGRPSPGYAPQGSGRNVHVLPSARLAAPLRCDVKVHALWRSGPWKFGSDATVVHLDAAPFVTVSLRGPLLLDVSELESGFELKLHRSVAIDASPVVHSSVPELPASTGSRLLDRHSTLRDSISAALPQALDSQIQIELENLLDSTRLSEPLLAVSLPRNGQSAALVRRCLRGEFDNLWCAPTYAETMQSGAIASLLFQPRVIPVQISYLDRKQWQHVDEFFQSAATTVTGAGEILITSALFDTIESCEDSMILASQERRRRSPSTMSVRASIECSLEQLRYFAPPDMWARANAFAISQPATSPKEIQCEYCLSIPRHALEVWFTTPRAGSGSFSLVYSVLSRSVQRALRKWVPAFWTEPMKKRHTRMAALVARLYGCSDPSIAAARADLVADWMSDEAVQHIWQTGASGLRRKLAEEKLGSLRTPYQCDVYARRQLELLNDWIWRDRLIPGILQMEAQFIEAFIHLGSACRQLDDSGQIASAIAVRGSIYNALGAARRIMRKFFMKVDYSSLVPMLFIEATNALNRTVGREYPVTVTVNLKAPSGAAKKISNQAANFPPGGHY